MSIFGDINNFMSKGANATIDLFTRGGDEAGRFATYTNLRVKQGDAERKYKEAVLKLGMELVDTVKAQPELIAGKEELLEAVNKADAERARVKEEIEKVTKESEAARKEFFNPRPTCPSCGATSPRGAYFCMNCGGILPVTAKAEEAYTENSQAEEALAEPTTEGAEAPVEAPAEEPAAQASAPEATEEKAE